jgi:hypothetical protein
VPHEIAELLDPRAPAGGTPSVVVLGAHFLPPIHLSFEWHVLSLENVTITVTASP